SSIENSPWSATISVRRSSPKPCASSESSSLRIFRRRGFDPRISLHSLMNFRTYLSSSSSLVISRAVSRASRMLRISADCFSDSLKRLRKLASAVGVSFDLRMIFTTSSMLSTAIFKPSRMCSRSCARFSSNSVPNDDGMAMLDEVLEDLLQVHFLRRPVDQGEHDRAEGRLHLRMLVELVQHDGRHGIALQVDDDAHPLAVRIILDVRDPVDLFVVRELGDLRDEIRLVHLIGNLRDDDLLFARGLLLLDDGAGP